MTISIIVPTLNEQENIGGLIRYLLQHKQGMVLEIIVADGGSTDDTVADALAAGATAIRCDKKGRAFQMNAGAAMATGDILYFIHADTIPPDTYATDIIKAIDNGFDFGRYRTLFEGGGWLLKVNAFFTRFDWFICQGGDQTLFMKRNYFVSLNGYDAGMEIMEEYDLTRRAKQLCKYIIMPKASLISTRKYNHNSWWQIQRANYTIVKMFKQGYSQDLLVKKYHQLIRQR